MHRFLIFVDGSNLSGSLRRMNLRVDDYEKFYRFIFDSAVETWRTTVSSSSQQAAQLFRTNWYVIGSMDEWDLADPKAQVTLREIFEREKDVRQPYMAMAGQKLAGQSQDKVAVEAWSMCFADLRQWYESRWNLLEGFHRFHYAIRSGTDFIDVVECGHWKVDLLYRTLLEKGLDTRLAVDMVTMLPNYDVAVLISGDADNIPSLDHIRDNGKHVAVVEFLGGYPPQKKGGGFSSKLKVAADFVVQIYEMSLVTKGLARKSEHSPAGNTGG